MSERARGKEASFWAYVAFGFIALLGVDLLVDNSHFQN
jgi:hypothetical protein